MLDFAVRNGFREGDQGLSKLPLPDVKYESCGYSPIGWALIFSYLCGT
jgi:hypothetical protein